MIKTSSLCRPDFMPSPERLSVNVGLISMSALMPLPFLWRRLFLSCRPFSSLLALSLLLLCARPVSAQTVGTTDTQLGVLVCVPDQTGAITVSQPPCPASPVASLQVINGVVLSVDDDRNLTAFDGPLDQSEAVNLALTCAGTVIALYLVSLGIGLCLRLIKRA